MSKASRSTPHESGPAAAPDDRRPEPQAARQDGRGNAKAQPAIWRGCRMILQRYPPPAPTMAVTLFGVAVIVFVAGARRARQSDRHDAAARARPRPISPAARPLRARQADPRAVLDLARPASLQGDFGTSISLRQDVLGLVFGRLPATLELCDPGACSSRVALGGALAHHRHALARHRAPRRHRRRQRRRASRCPISSGGWC